LAILNLFRIVNLVWIDAHYPDFMEVAHLVIWQGIIVLTAIIYWFLWAERSEFSD
jgi:exosortase/archaeosortase family protein